ncbi:MULTISPECIES: hypothetical protein [unclassified Nostoc]|uniref:hypothetical protein n=1 Tax=unclassified Nostoc TaxID=2593658 RepID=UPI00159F0AD9|nr:hypothetical protein [Nostoc sp. KVJ20]
MPSSSTSQAIESSPYRQEETQSDELQEWEGYSWVIFCLKVKSDTFSSLSETHSRSRGNAFGTSSTNANGGRLRHRMKVSEAVRSFAQPNSNW